MTPRQQRTMALLSQAKHHREGFANGTLVRERKTGRFSYVVGVVGGKPEGQTVYLLAPHPKWTWRTLADAKDVERAEAPEVRSA